MIFVTVGTGEVPFDRLMRAIGSIERSERLVVQAGSSELRPAGATLLDFLPYDELVSYVRSARVVVTHAGVGTVLTAMMAGKRPLVVPRLRRLGEAVDDHQLVFARRVAASGLVTLVEDVARLADAVADTPAPVTPPEACDGRLANELAALIAAETGARRAA
jgi:UDP-N-acetylglucosamine transferase subunit ALG13